MISNITDFKNWSVNDYADFWRYEVGVNVIPADTRNKRPKVEWKQFQGKPIPSELYNYWKKEDMFKDGIMIIAGQIWHNENKKGLILNCIDIDNELALQEFCKIKGVQKSLKKVADTGHFLIEQHLDDRTRAHVFVWSVMPFRKKTSSISVTGDTNVPKLEVKGQGNDSLVSVTPSLHKNGTKYEFIGDWNLGVMEPKIHNEIEQHINAICEDYGVDYLNGNGNSATRRFHLIEKKIPVGQRHNALVSYANSLIARLHKTTSPDRINQYFKDYNAEECEIPLPHEEIEQIWNDAVNFMHRTNNNDDMYESKQELEHSKDKEKSTKAEWALEIANASIKKLFVDEYQIPHAAILVKDHLEILPLTSGRFRNYLARETYKQNGIVIDRQTLKDVVGILSAKAEFDSGDPIKLNLRVAQVGNKWYYDLTNKDWEFIEITSDGWKIVKNQDPNLILFHRYSNQIAQVYPSKDYDPKIIQRFVELVLNESNVRKEKLEEYSNLLKCFTISAFIPDIPKPMPMPYGSQGAAKTSLMEHLKMTIDPSSILTLSLPTHINELIQQLSHNFVAFYDNISTLKDWQSDQICRATTGSGSSKRSLYTDDDDFIRSFMRCVALNGINLAATNPDILDRSLFFELKRIPDEERRYIKEVRRQFEDMRPQILCYVFDTLVKVKAWIENNNGTIKLDKLPRMADWAGHCEIIARCIGYQENEFLKAYKNNVKIQVEEVMETSLVATCIAYFVVTDKFNAKGIDGKPLEFEGTASELKKELEEIAPILGIDIKDKDWPKKPNGLTKIINELIHTLKEAGIEIEYDRKENVRIIKIHKTSSSSSGSTDQAQENHAQNDGYDGHDGHDDDLRINNSDNRQTSELR